jgi:hypothetical protein
MMDKELIVVPIIITVLLLVIFSTFVIFNEQHLRCVELVKDKPAAEIRVVCK